MLPARMVSFEYISFPREQSSIVAHFNARPVLTQLVIDRQFFIMPDAISRLAVD